MFPPPPPLSDPNKHAYFPVTDQEKHDEYETRT